MSEMVAVPASVWRQIQNDLDFLKKAITPLAKGYKPSEYMGKDDVMDTLSIGVDRLKQIRSSGQIRYRKFGKEIEYLRKDIEAYKSGDIIITSKK